MSLFKKITLGLLVFILAFVCFAAWSFSPFLKFIPQAPKIFEEGKTVLITLHNESELRPTLGFLTGFLLVENSKEHGIQINFYDSYDITPPSTPIRAPDVIEERFSQDVRYQGWVFRDSNFSWDFKKNAKDALSFFQYDERFQDLQIDTVIALDLYSIEQILDAVGGIEHDGKYRAGKDLFAVLEGEAKEFDRGDENAWLSRKDGIKPLAENIIKKIIFSPQHWKKVSTTAEKMLDQQHILLYSKNKDLQNSWKTKHWTGEINVPTGSVPWGINIANIGGKKGDRYIQKEIKTTFTLDESGNITERLRIHFDHEGTRNLHSDRYFGYVRVIKPMGSVLKKYEGSFLEDPKEISSALPNISEFDFVFYTDESDSRILELEFVYPSNISSSTRFILPIYFINQPGSTHIPNTVTVQGFADETIQIEGCESFLPRENIGICHTSFPNSKTLKIQKTADSTPPIFEDVVYKDDGKIIRLQFSEEIKPLSSQDISITSNQNPLTIEAVTMDTRAVEIILTNNLPSASRQFYDIAFTQLSDLFGNAKSGYIHTVAYPKYKEE